MVVYMFPCYFGHFIDLGFKTDKWLALLQMELRA